MKWPSNSSVLIPPGAYHDKITAGGEVLSDHMLFGTVVATMLIVVVTAQGWRRARFNASFEYLFVSLLEHSNNVI